MLEILKLDSFQSFVISSEAGLTGNSIVAQYPCLLDGKKFFVWIGNTDITIFTKSTFMNLANFAEEKGAEDLYIILNKTHVQKSMFDRMFKVIDAQLVRSANAQDLIKKDLIAKALDVVFYKMLL